MSLPKYQFFWGPVRKKNNHINPFLVGDFLKVSQPNGVTCKSPRNILHLFRVLASFPLIMWVRLSRFQRTGRNFWSRNIVMRLGFLTTILWDNIQRMKQRGVPCITWWLCKNSRIQMSQTQTKAMGRHYFRPSIFKKLLFRIQRRESFLFWSI